MNLRKTIGKIFSDSIRLLLVAVVMTFIQGYMQSAPKNPKSKAASRTQVQTKARPEMPIPPRPDFFLEDEAPDFERVFAYAGGNIFICDNGQWKRFEVSKPKKAIPLHCEVKDNKFILTEKPGVEYWIDRHDLLPSKFVNGDFDKQFSILKDSYSNPVGHGYMWSPVSSTVEGLYICFDNFILLRSGEYWQEFRPDTYHGLWAEYRTKREDAGYYYIANSESELKVPKKISKTGFTHITSDNYGTFCLHLITDTPKTKLSVRRMIPATLRTGSQTLAAVRYDLVVNHRSESSPVGSKGYICVGWKEYFVCKDKRGLWQQYTQSEADKAPKEWWLTGETDTHFILRNEAGNEFRKISKADKNGNLSIDANIIEFNQYGQTFINKMKTAFTFFNSDAREVFFPEWKGGEKSYFVKDGTQLTEYGDNGRKKCYDILYIKPMDILAEGVDGTKIKIVYSRLQVERPGEKPLSMSSDNFESDTWAPRPTTKNSKMLAYERAEAVKERKAKMAAAEAERKRKAELAAAEKKRKADLAAAEMKRKAELAAAEKRKKAEQQKAVASTGGQRAAGGSAGSSKGTTTRQSSQTSQQSYKVCVHCNGSKTNPCTYCNSSGHQKCIQCMGVGQNRRGIATGNGVMWVMDPCYSCRGTGFQNCIACGGRGVVVCVLCGGKGRELTDVERQIKMQNDRETAELYREIRESNENLRNQQRQADRKQEYEHRNRRALCSYCNGTGASSMAETSQPSATVGIKHYNSVGNKCPYCKTDEYRYTQHWHAQCIHCK